MAKVVTLTPNPAIDRTLRVRRLVPHAQNRVTLSRSDPGGKGINVATALIRLGIDAVAVFPAGGEAGRWLRDRVVVRGVRVRTIDVAGEMRTNIKIIDSEDGGVSTELNEPGPQISPEESLRILEGFLDEARNAEFAVLSGSVPPGMSEDVYHRLITELRRMGIPAALDASGLLLARGILAGPCVVKPNREEACELLERKIDVPGGLGAALRDLQGFMLGECPPRCAIRAESKAMDNVASKASPRREPASIAVISLGPEGAAFGQGDRALWVKSCKKGAVNPTGCGDALLAGIVAGAIRGLEFEEMAKFAVACATAVAFKEGTEFPFEDEVRETIDSIFCQPMNER